MVGVLTKGDLSDAFKVAMSAVRLKGLDDTCRIVLIGVISCIDSDDGRVHVTLKDLSRKVSISVDSVKKSLQTLTDTGLILWEGDSGNRACKVFDFINQAVNLKVALDKSSNDKALLPSEDFEFWWRQYPRTKRVSKKEALKRYEALINQGVSHEALLKACLSYKAYVESNRVEERYILHPSTFLGPQERWKGFLESDTPRVCDSTSELERDFRRSFLSSPEFIRAYRGNAG